MKRLDSLTGLRFIAALHVVCYHASVPVFGHRGEVSVSLFFVLSGFVLVYGSREVGPSRFWRARLARIYPLYLLGLVASVPMLLDDLGDQPAGLVASGIMVLTMTQAWLPQTTLRWNYPAWSLSAEAFFYAVFPLAAPAVRRLRHRTLILAALALWVLIKLIVTLPHGSDWSLYTLKYDPLVRLPEFLLGMVVGQLYTLRLERVHWSLSLAAGVQALVTVAVFPERGNLAIIFAILVFTLASVRGPLASVPMVRLGEASYALYILHAPVLYWVGPEFLAASILLCVITSIAAQRFEVTARRWILSQPQASTCSTRIR